MIAHPGFQALAGIGGRPKKPEGEIRKIRKQGLIYFVCCNYTAPAGLLTTLLLTCLYGSLHLCLYQL
jgi:hypothetical protein